MASAQSHSLANMKYRDKAYDRFEITIPRGKREEYRQAAQQRGFSLAAMVKMSIEEFIANHPVEEE